MANFFIKTLVWFSFLLKLSLLVALPSAADEWVLSYGLGVFHSAERLPTEVKIISLARKQDFDQVSYWQVELGGWTDIGGGGRTGSMYGAGSVGVKVDLRPIYFSNSLGLGLITSPDAYLGGVFPEFVETFTVGVQGANNASLGLSYKHISSAGIFSPNIGRDFILLNVGIGIW